MMASAILRTVSVQIADAQLPGQMIGQALRAKKGTCQTTASRFFVFAACGRSAPVSRY